MGPLSSLYSENIKNHNSCFPRSRAAGEQGAPTGELTLRNLGTRTSGGGGGGAGVFEC